MIRYDPTKLLRKAAPKSKIKKMVGPRLTLKKAALSFVDDLEVVSKRSITSVALKTIKRYKQRVKDDPTLRKELSSDPKALIQSVQNAVIAEVTESIKEKYSGEFYIWTPSDASEPDPEHQLNYGKRFKIGDGEMPGERPGCRCGMQILVEDSRLEI